jgi:hypothetical protein
MKRREFITRRGFMAHPVARTRAERADGHKSPAAKAP